AEAKAETTAGWNATEASLYVKLVAGRAVFHCIDERNTEPVASPACRPPPISRSLCSYGETTPPSRGRLKEGWMSVPIAVAPTVVRYRRGLLDALQESGFPPAQPPDIFAWARSGGRRAIILTLSTRKELTAVARLQNSA